MAYRHAGGPYRQRGLGAEHPRTSHQNTAATSFNSYESVGASIYHPHLSQSRERRSSVPFSEHAHGPGFPQREQLPPVLAAGGRESVDGRARGEKQPYQESSILFLCVCVCVCVCLCLCMCVCVRYACLSTCQIELENMLYTAADLNTQDMCG